jgi:hypothetical protein
VGALPYFGAWTLFAIATHFEPLAPAVGPFSLVDWAMLPVGVAAILYVRTISLFEKGH